MSTKLNLKDFKERLGSWWTRLEPLFLSGEMDKVYDFLKKESSEGKKITPLSGNTYRAFKETNYNDLQCVIITEEPYSSFIGEIPLATGKALDCSLANKMHPNLRIFYSKIEKELFNGLNLEYNLTECSVDYLSQQGVFMYTSSLTVEKDVPKSHIAIWNIFTIYLLKECIAPTGVPVLFLEKENKEKYEKLIEKTNYCYSICEENVFTKINKNIWDSNKETVNWLPYGNDTPF